MVMNNGLVDHFLKVIDKDEPAKPPYYPNSFLPTTSKTLNCLLELDGQFFTLNKCLKMLRQKICIHLLVGLTRKPNLSSNHGTLLEIGTTIQMISIMQSGALNHFYWFAQYSYLPILLLLVWLEVKP